MPPREASGHCGAARIQEANGQLIVHASETTVNTWIALFRGINVGGNNILPMANLKALVEGLDCKNVRTYIQSGNVIFDTATSNARSLTMRISDRIEQQHGFRPRVLLLTREDFRKAITANPFPSAVSDHKSLHFYFLAEPPKKLTSRALDKTKSSTETFTLIDRVLYLHAPDGIGRSKLAANAEKLLGVSATARNYHTVEKIAAMLAEH